MTRPPLRDEPRQASVDDRELIDESERLAERLLTDAIQRQGRRERFQGRRIARLLDDEEGLAFVLALTDEVLRIRDPARAARHFEELVGGDRTPRFLGRVDAPRLRFPGELDGLRALRDPDAEDDDSLTERRRRRPLVSRLAPKSVPILAKPLRCLRSRSSRLNLVFRANSL